MIEVRWHGRGGQGAFTAARLLGSAAMYDQRFALAFPSFGPERRGAPIQAFTRIDDRRIADRSAIRTCDFVVVLDDTLVGPQALEGIREGGALLVNTASPQPAWGDIDARIICVDATLSARTILGRPIVNTAMLGALMAATGVDSVEAAATAIEQEMSPALAAKNIAVLRQCHDRVKEGRHA